MKRFLTILMATSAIFAFNSCKEDNPIDELEGPSVTWPSNSSFATVDITDDLDANLTVTVPAGISTFVVTVDSDALEAALGVIGITTSSLDLINDETVIGILDTVTGGQLPTGEDLAGKTEVNFNISSLVQLINTITSVDSNHSFTLDVTDANGKSAEVTCTFHRVAPDAPTMTWESNPDFETQELSEQMDVRIDISAPAGISTFIVTVDSDALESVIGLVNNGSTEMDLINGNPALLELLSGFGVPTGAQLRNQTSVSLDLSALVPLIIQFNPSNDSNHTFTLDLTDNAGQTLSRSATFHYTGASAATVSDVDLWANTATVTIEGEAGSVQYREKGTESWNGLAASEGVYTIAPQWVRGTNDAGLTVYSLKEGTGIFAGKTYEIQVNGEIIAEYTADGGDVIPNGDMSGWSKKGWENGGNNYEITYPNAEDESFWDSGNNMITEQVNPLCQEDNGSAMLSSQLVLGFMLAPGNMYTGRFDYTGMVGTANFGQVYDWTARPSALKLSYKAEVGTIDQIGASDPDGESYAGQQDITRIYAVVVDWSAQHGVTSGLGTPSGMWDPALQNSVEEGAILGYASLEITENQSEFTEVEIPFVWYDTESRPADGNYSVVISCATSNRGDYLTGCSTNKLWVDNFEWCY